jgi:hypothetical protein
MKPLYTSAAILIFAVLLAGCKTQHVPYHSTADIPYATTSTSTQMELIVGDDEMKDKREYVVFVASDNGQNEYALIAPQTSNTSGYSFDAANLGRSVPLPEDNVTALIDGLADALQIWDKSSEEEEGAFYEFSHAPEQDIDRISENVVRWHPALKVTISHTPDGPAGRMLVGDSPKQELQHVVEFDKREELADFRNLLKEARTQMSSVASR